MATEVKKKIFLVVFCLASIVQGMYSTYFVSILTTIERIYQIQSKTAGAIMSGTEVGEIIGSLLIAYYGGKGNKPKWMSACMTLTALAALISTSPHFLLRTTTNHHHSSTQPYLTSDLSTTESIPTLTQKVGLPCDNNQSCYHNTVMRGPLLMNLTTPLGDPATLTLPQQQHQNFTNTSDTYAKPVLVILYICLLAIGFGSTAINTLGIPFIDDIVSKEDSPIYLGLTIGLKIFGPALGFLLGSFCIRLDVNLLTLIENSVNSDHGSHHYHHANKHLSTAIAGASSSGIGAWWLGIVIISLPLLILALPMYILSRSSVLEKKKLTDDDYEDITYQAAEDHDIGGSHDFQPHVITVADLDVTSNRTCYSEVVDSTSREVLQLVGCAGGKPAPESVVGKTIHYDNNNFNKNISLDQPLITKDSILNNNKVSATKNKSDPGDGWRASCVVVNHFGGLESTSFIKEEEEESLKSSSSCASSSGGNCHQAKPLQLPPPSSSASSMSAPLGSKNQTGSLSRLIKNKLLLLRMLSGVLHILPIAGFYTFLPKYLVEQFGIAASSASAISGLAGIMFVGMGAFLGGTMIRLFNINSRWMTRWIAASALIYSIGMLINLTGSLTQYIIIFSICTLIHSSSEVGGMIFNLRCVKSDDRTLAMGLSTFTSSLLGSIPCTIIYGSLIDLTCVQWDKLIDGISEIPQNGACRAYNNERFRFYLHGVTAFVMFLAFIVDCIICLTSKKVDFYDHNSNKNDDDSSSDATMRLKKSSESI